MIITRNMVFKLIMKDEGKPGICNHSAEKLNDITINPNWKGYKIEGGLKYV
jgi:acetoacetate decarboxylase